MASILPATYVEGFHNVDAVKKMPYTPFGKTGMHFSALGLGGAPFSNSLFGECERQEGYKIVDFSLRSGVNFIDTAPWYGQGKSEELLGEALANIPREAYYISTKVGRYELDFAKMFDFSAKKVSESFDISLKLLGLDYVDIVHIHDSDCAPSPDIILEETLPTLEEFVIQGQAKFIGITGYSLSALKYIADRSKIKLSSILSYARQTIFDNSLKEYVDDFVGHSLGVISAAPLAMGLLTNQGPQPWHPACKKLIDLSKQAGDICKSKGIELGKLAIYGSIKSIPREKVPTVLIGVNTQKQFQENMDVIINGLTEKEKVVYSEIEKLFGSLESSEKHWEGEEMRRLRSMNK